MSYRGEFLRGQGSMKTSKIGKVALVLFFLACCSVAYSQRSSSSASLLKDFKSSDKQRREAAYNQIKDDKEALRRPEVKRALIELLDREEHVAPKPGEELGEGYIEYITNLADTVTRMADWNDLHQVCVLAESPYDSHSDFATELATKGGKAAVPCLLKMARGGPGERSGAIPVLVQLSAVTTDLPPADRQKVRQAIIVGLRDSEAGVRQEIVDAVNRFGTPDFIPVLEDIARSDPESLPGSRMRDGKEHFPIREAAAKAIQSIQGRANAK